MHCDIREVYWWNVLKRDISILFAKCLNRKQVKVKHQKLGGLFKDICIPAEKWKDVNMHIVVDICRTRRKHDSIWIIIDEMIKSTKFTPVKGSY